MSCRRFVLLVVVLTPLLLVEASVRRASADEKSGEPVLVLRGLAGKSVRLTPDDLKKLPHAEVEATDHHGNKGRYSGVPMRVILDKLDVPQGEKLRGMWIRSYLLVHASDNYAAVFAIPELDPGFTDRTVILADSRDGHPLAKGRGPFQVIVPGEKRQARWVYGVNEIRLVDSQPAEK